MRINPLTYGVEALRALLYPDSPAYFLAGLVDGHAGAVLAIHVRVGVCGGQSQEHETGGVTFPALCFADIRGSAMNPCPSPSNTPSSPSSTQV